MLKITYAGKELDKDSYTLTYQNNVNVGTAKLIITGLGEFGGTKTVTFKIIKQKMSFKEKLFSLLSEKF